jgi:hypothetical protein
VHYNLFRVQESCPNLGFLQTVEKKNMQPDRT